MRVYDTSFYYADEVIENYLLEILPVNKSVWVPFNIAKDFHIVFNSANLRYKRASDNDDLIDIPDGVYELKLSYRPNIRTLQHFLHLRTVELMNKLRIQQCKLLDEKCNISRQEYVR